MCNFFVHSLNQEADLILRTNNSLIKGGNTEISCLRCSENRFLAVLCCQNPGSSGDFAPWAPTGALPLDPTGGLKHPQLQMPRIQNSVKFWARSAPGRGEVQTILSENRTKKPNSIKCVISNESKF